jgi:hypothetical protein
MGGYAGLQDAQPRYRLLTTLLDPRLAPAMELAALYHQRWEIESVFDELKTHLRQSRRVLRSKTPELVRQEFFGWVLAHYAVRWLLHQGATRHRIPHAELSFKGHVELLRRTQPPSGAFPPQSDQDVDDAGSMNCSKPAPAPEPPGPSIGVRRAWSSAETRSTLLMTEPHQPAFPWIAHPAESLTRQAGPCHGPRGYASGLQQPHRAAFTSKRTVLAPNRARGAGS